jgi:16S rRNA (adenine1518-N6/adenine1519-N6)-dimethyltransferase
MSQTSVLGRAPRTGLHRLGLKHRGVHVFLLAPDGRLRFRRRQSDRDARPSALDCSVSEHLILGEDYGSSQMREGCRSAAFPRRQRQKRS